MSSARSRTLLLSVGLALATSVSPARGQGTDSFAGTWRLVSMVTRDPATGNERSVWEGPQLGLLIYTADGHMSAQLYDSQRPKLGVPWQSASAESARSAFAGLSTYFGTYAVDTRAQTVTHTVEGAMAPDWIGTKLVRRYRFLDSDRVELSVIPDAQVVTQGLVLVWQRVR